MRAGPPPADHGGLGGLHRHDLDPRILLLQKLPCARNRPPGPDARDEDVHPALCLRPDLRAGRLVVDLGVGRVLKLLQDECAGRGGGDLLGLGDRALHPRRGVGQHQRRPEGLEQHAALDRHRGRHGQHELVPLGGGDEGQGDARVPAGGLDERRAAGGAEARRLCGLDHRAADAFFVFCFCCGLRGRE